MTLSHLRILVTSTMLAMTCIATPQRQDNTQQNTVLDFEHAKPGKNIGQHWRILTENTTDKTRAVCFNTVFESFKTAIRLTASTNQNLTLISTKSFPAKLNDTFLITAVFRSTDGKAKAKFGLLQDGKYPELTEINPINNEWDRRSVFVTINRKTTEAVNFCLVAQPDQTIEYSHLAFRKISPDELKLYSPKSMEELWKKRTEGNNLARNATVTFEPKPNYQLTIKGNSDPNDLIDGYLCNNNALWFEPKAVAWFRAFNGATIIVDLKQIKPVHKLVIRINGGKLGWGTQFPLVLEAWTSRNGKEFHLTQSLKKTAPLEGHMADWKALYYLPESPENKAVPYVYPFELDIRADARYVAVRAPVYTALMMVTDELAVMEATPQQQKAKDYNQAYQKRAEPLVHHDVIIRPRMDKLYLATNLKLPNWLRLDSRLENNHVKLTYTMDMPRQVQFTEEKSWPAFPRHFLKQTAQGQRMIFHFAMDGDYAHNLHYLKQYHLGPFFFSLKPGAQVPENQQYAVFTTFINGKKNSEHRTPIEFIEIPESPKFKRLSVSMAVYHRLNQWPESLQTMEKIGFNTLLVFPLLKTMNKSENLIRDAVKRGFKIRQMFSPNAFMKAWHKTQPEIFCNQQKKISVCPAYRGKYHQEIIEKLRQAIINYPADYVTFDEEEWFTTGLNAMMECPRCQKLKQRTNLDWKSYMNWIQADCMATFTEAVREGARQAGRKQPKVGFYALIPDESGLTGACYPSKAGTIHWLGEKFLAPNHVDEYQDSYYGRSSLTASKRARAVYLAVKNPADINSWITGGSGAHMETAYSNRTGQHFIETIMNGAGGVQYYTYSSFESPLDYYYHARAAKMIQPYEDILMDGALDEHATGSNLTLRYTRRYLNGQALILIGNYQSPIKKNTVITIPNNALVTNLVNGKIIPGKDGKLPLTVPADDFVLLHVRQL